MKVLKQEDVLRVWDASGFQLYEAKGDRFTGDRVYYLGAEDREGRARPVPYSMNVEGWMARAVYQNEERSRGEMPWRKGGDFFLDFLMGFVRAKTTEELLAVSEKYQLDLVIPTERKL